MQQAVERALDRADYVIASAQQRPPKRKCSSSGAASLFEKLYDIYVEECGKEPEATEELRSNANLLEKLVRRESLACLVVNLHPGGEGYSLMLEGKQGSCSETIRLPYEEGELLEYLDAEELPPALVDLLEQSQVNIFHCGCVIAQVRDYRQCSHGEPAGYQTRHVLLRPTMQTLACDMQSITSDGQQWTEEEKLLLESQLILATAEPLCLDPSLSVACAANRLLYNKQKMNTRPMKRSFRRYSAPSLTRQQELSQYLPPPELRVLTSFKKSKESKTSENSDFIISKADYSVDTWKQRPCDLAIPSEVDVQKYVKWEKFVKYDNSKSTVLPAHEVKDDSVFGYEGGDESQTTKATFMKSLNDPLISGKRKRRKKVRNERPMSPPHPSTDDHSNNVLPGSKSDTEVVIIQSEVLVHQKAQCPVTTSSYSSSGSASPSRLPPEKETEQPKILSFQSSVLGKGVRHPSTTIKLPSSSGKNLSGDSFTPLQGSSFLKSPSPVLASKLPGLSQVSSLEVNPVSTFPVAILSTVSSPQRTRATEDIADSSGQNIIKVVGPRYGVQALGSGSGSGQGSTSGTTAPSGTKPSSLPSGAQPPQAPSQVGVQFILKIASNIRPVTVLQLPESSLLLNTQQQPQQQWLYQLIPQQPQQPTTSSQQPTTSCPQQPVPQGSSAEGSSGQRAASSAQQDIVLNLPGAGSFLQPQAAVVVPLGSVESQKTSEQSHPGQTVQLSPASQPQPKQQVQLRILQGPVAVATAVAQTAQLHPLSEQTANQSKGKMKRSTSTTPES
uniref:Transcription factor SPT20 homolog n=1 Tax=Canis lupus dingo TaxID=286419 RepID=A0A8C0K021_CANLU